MNPLKVDKIQLGPSNSSPYIARNASGGISFYQPSVGEVPFTTILNEKHIEGVSYVSANDVGADFTTIQDAINDLPAEGGVVFVYSGTYSENLVISKNVFLIARGEVTLETAGNLISVSDANLFIYGFSFNITNDLINESYYCIKSESPLLNRDLSLWIESCSFNCENHPLAKAIYASYPELHVYNSTFSTAASIYSEEGLSNHFVGTKFSQVTLQNIVTSAFLNSALIDELNLVSTLAYVNGKVITLNSDGDSTFSSITLSSLSDVDTTGINDGEVLAWDAAQEKFLPTAMGGGGGGASDLNDLTDVTIAAPNINHFLVNNGAGQFVNRTISTSDLSNSANIPLLNANQTFTGNTRATTQPLADNSTLLASTAFVQQEINALNLGSASQSDTTDFLASNASIDDLSDVNLGGALINGKILKVVGGVITQADEAGGGGFTQEEIEDFVGAMFVDGGGVTWTYDDDNSEISAVITLASTNLSDTANLARLDANQTFTGNTRVSNQPLADNSTLVANTAFVQQEINALNLGSASQADTGDFLASNASIDDLSDVNLGGALINGKVLKVVGGVLTQADEAGGLDAEQVQDLVGGMLVNGGGVTWTYDDDNAQISASVSLASTDLSNSANIALLDANQTFTGNTRATTQPLANNSTLLASTAFVQQEINALNLGSASQADTGDFLASNASIDDLSDVNLGGALINGKVLKVVGGVLTQADEAGGLDAEQVQDLVGGMLVDGGGVTWTYDDDNAQISASVSLASTDLTNSLNIPLLDGNQTFTGDNNFTTKAINNNSTSVATTAYVEAQIDNDISALSLGSASQADTGDFLANNVNPLAEIQAGGAGIILIAQQNLNLEPDVDVQAYSAQLATLADLDVADGNFIVGNGVSFVVESGAVARTSLGLGSAATSDTGDFLPSSASLDDLSDVTIVAPDLNHFLVNNGAGQFINRTITTSDLTDEADLARLDSPALIGTPTAPTAILGTNTTQIATTEYVQNEISALDLGDSFQPLDATLTSISALGTASDKYIYTTGVDTWAEGSITAFGRSLLDDADEATARATLGVELGVDVQAYDPTLSGLASVVTVADQIIYTNGVDSFAATSLTANARAFLGTDVELGDISDVTIGGLANGQVLIYDGGVWQNSDRVLFKDIAQSVSGDYSFTGDVDLTGANATATTQANADDSTKIATTAFVKNIVAAVGAVADLDDLTDVVLGGIPLTDGQVLRYEGATNLFKNSLLAHTDLSDHSDYALLDSPSFLGTPNAPTPLLGDSSTLLATTAFVRGEINDLNLGTAAQSDSGDFLANGAGLIDLSDVGIGDIPLADGQVLRYHALDGEFKNVFISSSDLSNTANIALLDANQTFTGTVGYTGTLTALTQNDNDGSTKVATTLYVDRQVSNLSTSLSLNDLTDVFLNPTSNLQVLAFVQANNRFENISLSSADLSDGASLVKEDINGDISITRNITLGGTLDASEEGQVIANFTFNNGNISSLSASVDFNALDLVTTGTITAGNLVVNGTTTTINTVSLAVKDPIIRLSTGADTVPVATTDTGFVFTRGSTQDPAAFYWDRVEEEFFLATASGATDLTEDFSALNPSVQTLNVDSLKATSSLLAGYGDLGQITISAGSILSNNNEISFGAAELSTTALINAQTPPANSDTTEVATTAWVRALSIDALSDVDTSTTPPNANDILAWNGASWVPSNELTQSQTSLGLNTDGTLPVYISTHYINDGDNHHLSLGNLDNELFNANNTIENHTTQIGNIQTELNDTQLGAGLEETGLYEADLTTNYLTLATSLKDADFKLDAQIKANSDTLASFGTIVTSDTEDFLPSNASLNDLSDVTINDPALNHVLVNNGAGQFVNRTLSTSDLTDETDLARLESPSFTGTPLAPTAILGTNTTQIATTEYVQTELTNLDLSDTYQPLNDRLNEISGLAPTLDNFIVGDGNNFVLKTPEDVAAIVAVAGGFQPLDATLTSISALGTASDKYIYTTGVDTWAEGSITTFGRNLLDDADAATARTTLGLGSAATANTTDFLEVGASLNDIADVTINDPALNHFLVNNGAGQFINRTISTSDLSDSTDIALLESPSFTGTPLAPTAVLGTNTTQIATTEYVQSEITNLSLGTAAQSDATDFLSVANNLSDLADASTARNNLGLTSTATTALNTLLQVANNLSDLADASTSRNNLGLTSTATTALTALLQVANALQEIATAGLQATARTNLGLGSSAVLNAGTGANQVLQLDGSAQLPSISTHNDVAIAGLVDNQILKSNDGVFENVTFSSTNLTDTADLVRTADIGTSASYDVGTTNGTIPVLTANGLPAVSGVNLTNLGSIGLHSDVDLTGLEGGNTLLWDDINEKFIPSAPDGGLTENQVRNIAGTALANGVHTGLNSISFTNDDLNDRINLSISAQTRDLTDVSNAVPTNGQILQYNGALYVPVSLGSSSTVNIGVDAGQLRILTTPSLANTNDRGELVIYGRVIETFDYGSVTAAFNPLSDWSLDYNGTGLTDTNIYAIEDFGLFV